MKWNCTTGGLGEYPGMVVLPCGPGRYAAGGGLKRPSQVVRKSWMLLHVLLHLQVEFFQIFFWNSICSIKNDFVKMFLDFSENPKGQF
jgi:hypothetical protein